VSSWRSHIKGNVILAAILSSSPRQWSCKPQQAQSNPWNSQPTGLDSPKSIHNQPCLDSNDLSTDRNLQLTNHVKLAQTLLSTEQYIRQGAYDRDFHLYGAPWRHVLQSTGNNMKLIPEYLEKKNDIWSPSSESHTNENLDEPSIIPNKQIENISSSIPNRTNFEILDDRTTVMVVNT